jgi:hypothetical protein
MNHFSVIPCSVPQPDLPIVSRLLAPPNFAISPYRAFAIKNANQFRQSGMYSDIAFFASIPTSAQSIKYFPF